MVEYLRVECVKCAERKTNTQLLNIECSGITGLTMLLLFICFADRKRNWLAMCRIPQLLVTVYYGCDGNCINQRLCLCRLNLGQTGIAIASALVSLGTVPIEQKTGKEADCPNNKVINSANKLNCATNTTTTTTTTTATTGV